MWYNLRYILVILSLITPIETKEVIVEQNNHTHVRKMGHTSDFPFVENLCENFDLLMNFEKPEKSDF